MAHFGDEDWFSAANLVFVLTEVDISLMPAKYDFPERWEAYAANEDDLIYHTPPVAAWEIRGRHL